MTFSHDDSREQLHVRLDASFKGRVESFAEAHGVSLNELTLTALDDYLPDEDTATGPTDSKLRDPYRWLRENADDRGDIPAELAMTELAQELGMNKQLVQKTRLKPLERKGWIDPDFGTIEVINPERHDND